MVVRITLRAANRYLISFNILGYTLSTGVMVMALVRLERGILVGIGISNIALRVITLWWTSLRSNDIPSRGRLVEHWLEKKTKDEGTLC